MPYQEPEFAPWEGRRVPVAFLGGYLGVGKTTILNRLLERTSLKVAVFVNDVGSVNIDAALIKKRTGDMIELTDGCICCSLSEGFAAAFDQLRQRPTPPDHILVELSGVAEPDRLRPWASTTGFTLDGIVVLIDADQFLDQSASETTGYKIRRQIAAADLLVLTKTDLVEKVKIDQVKDSLKQIDQKKQVLVSQSPEALAAILEIGGHQFSTPAALPATSLFDQHVVEEQKVSSEIDMEELQHLVSSLAADQEVVRAKGIVRVASDFYNVQVVGQRSSLVPLSQAELVAGFPTSTIILIKNVADKIERNMKVG